MSVDSPSGADVDFYSVARNLGLLDEEQTTELAKRSTDSGTPPAQLAQQAGLLDASQVDIIETLLHPTEAVPGYEITRVIGRGGMGVVYRARQLNLDREVALKTILVSRMADKSALSRFEQEAQTVGRLRHPNVIAAYDFGRHEGRLYLAMELVEGEDAETFIERHGPLSERTAWGIARQTAAGLAHAARHEVVHRDIKPANLLLVDAPEGFPLPAGVPMVKITDFGLAFLAGGGDVETRLTNPSSTVGSPHYMAPEQLADATVDHRADIYALGASLYHLLAGRPPFDDLNLSQIIARKLAGDLAPIHEVAPTISSTTSRLVERMMSRDPADRFETYGELLDAIDALDRARTTTEKLPSVGVEVTGPTNDGPAPSLADVATTQTMPVSGDTTYSFETSPVHRNPQWWKKWLRNSSLVLTGLIILVLIITCGLLLSRLPSRNPRVTRVPMESTGWSTPLFYGTTTSGWQNLSGNWVVGQDDEGAAVLAGTDGVAARPLFLREDEEGRKVAPEFFRLQFFVQPNAASAVAFHYALEPMAERDGRRTVMRLAETGAVIGGQSSDAAALDPLDEPVPLSRPWKSRHHVVLERLPTGWFVTVDEQPLPAVSLREGGELPEVRLSAEGGPAWFSDMLIEELVPVAKDDGSSQDAGAPK